MDQANDRRPGSLAHPPRAPAALDRLMPGDDADRLNDQDGEGRDTRWRDRRREHS